MLSSFFSQSNTTMVGIDIGSYAVKAVLLEQDGETVRLIQAVQEPIPKGIINEREIQDIEALGKAIGKLRKHFPKNIKLAAAAVSGSTVITKTIYMDVNLTEDEMESQIEVEADSLIPYPLEEVSLDFERLEVNEADPSKVNVLLSAARNDSVQARVAAIEAAGFTAKVIDVESYALSRSADLIYAQLPDDAANKLVGIVDMGANMTLMTVLEDGEAIYTRDQNFGGEQYTKNIVNYYNKSFDEAELAKKNGDLPPNYTFEVLAPFQTSVIQQIRRAIQMFLTSSGNNKLDYLVLSGGTAMLEGMKQVIEDELGVHVVVANPFAGMDISGKIDSTTLEQGASAYMIAAGLALRSFNPCHI
ncbi:pilus assembly protein PilM [Saccharobesus litoralis]|uniref:Pilus assembly protein PilM n=1 Tax=Saccharobesus litoralis TaxID=2172099 RepID=A0A2S0VQK2_9ALTE|nr:pilus assembly protein PilM [Saccharobesus litoralis]AWB66488.1 pilus assembly protein PilM [Saccharobesus litoralis]